MRTQSRFVTAIVKSSKEAHPPMPWARGATREMFISRRKENASGKKAQA